jgi:carbonic anhydrase
MSQKSSVPQPRRSVSRVLTSDNVAVVGVLFEARTPNDLINLLWASMPAGANQRRMLGNNISALGLLPDNRSYFRYGG